ncbi:MAG: helix-turn-helix transcriptional regulator [Phycisphaeraceae bacterium]
MATSDRFRLKDMRSVYRLVADCCDVGGNAEAWRLRMLDGLRELVSAQVALCMQLHDVGTDDERIAAPLDAGFLSGAGRALWGRYQRERAYRDDPFHLGFYGRFTGSLRTRCLASVVEAPTWRRSRHYNDFVRACGLEDRITSSLRLPQLDASAMQVIVLHRAAGDGPYTRRAQRLVHLFHHELAGRLGGMLALPEAESAEPALPRRLQQVLACLLRGDSEKQVARRLHISPHTVNRHVQRLHQRFDVRSRGELLFRCRDMLPTLEA